MCSKDDDKRKVASLLQDDILNGPMHCFGSHHKCKPECCKIVRSTCNSTNVNLPGRIILSSTPSLTSSCSLPSSDLTSSSS